MGYAYASSGDLDQLLAFGSLEVCQPIDPRYILATARYPGYGTGKHSPLKNNWAMGAGHHDMLRKEELLTSLFTELAYDVWDHQIVLVSRICWMQLKSVFFFFFNQ